MELLGRTWSVLIPYRLALKWSTWSSVAPLHTQAPDKAHVTHMFKHLQPSQKCHNSTVLHSKRESCGSAESFNSDGYIHASDPDTERTIKESFCVFDDFISSSEEDNLFNEIEPYLKRLRYEVDHWDDAIHGYRETERKDWNEVNRATLQKVQDLAFPPGTPKLTYTHLLDLEKTGYIKPHIDSVRFCGSTIAGLSLLSPCVMRLVHEKDPTSTADVLLNRRSLYIMKGASRYNYTHEVLKDELSIFKGRVIPRDRRISIMCRNEASANDQL